MLDADALREEIEHLRTLSALNTDQKVLAEIDALIHELERRIRLSGDGHAASL
jgi:hypothetical protein